jgi:hypothetical protein
MGGSFGDYFSSGSSAVGTQDPLSPFERFTVLLTGYRDHHSSSYAADNISGARSGQDRS